MEKKLLRALLLGAAAAAAAYMTNPEEQAESIGQTDKEAHEHLTNQLCDVDSALAGMAMKIESQLENLAAGFPKKMRKKLKKKADSLHLAMGHLSDAQRYLDQALYY